jgi:hypothetical protein
VKIPQIPDAHIRNLWGNRNTNNRILKRLKEDGSFFGWDLFGLLPVNIRTVDGHQNQISNVGAGRASDK